MNKWRHIATFFFQSNYEVAELGSRERASAILYKFNLLLLQQASDIRSSIRRLGGGNDFEESKIRFLNIYVRPLVEYLMDMIDESNSILYVLEKYKLRTEWFLTKI